MKEIYSKLGINKTITAKELQRYYDVDEIVKKNKGQIPKRVHHHKAQSTDKQAYSCIVIDYLLKI